MSHQHPAWLLETRPELADSAYGGYQQHHSASSSSLGIPAGFLNSGPSSLASGGAGASSNSSSSLTRNIGAYQQPVGAPGSSSSAYGRGAGGGGGGFGGGDDGPGTADGQSLHVPPGPRTFGMIDPPRRALYRMMVRQLLSDGHADAAMAVVRSTGVVVAAPAAEPQKLLELVQVGASASRLLGLSSAAPTSGAHAADRGLVEDVLYAADPYSLFSLPQPAAFDYKEWYTSKSFERPVRCVAFDQAGSVVAVGTASGEVRLYSAQLADEYARSASAAELQTPSDAALVRAMPGLHPGHSVEAVALHPAHPIVVSGGRDGRLSFTKYSTQFGSAAQAASAATALSGSASTNLLGHKTVATHHDTFAVRCVAMHPAGDVVLFGTDHNAPRLYHIETGHVFTPSTANQMQNQELDQQLLAAGITTTTTTAMMASSSSSAPFGGMRGGNVVDLGQAAMMSEQQRQFVARQQRDNDPTSVHIGSITDVAYAPDGRCFATASFDGAVRIFDGRAGSEVARYGAAHCSVAVTSLQFSRSGYVLLTAGLDSQVRLWDLRKPAGGAEVASFCSTGGRPIKQRVQCRARACFSADEHSILTTNSDFTGILHVDAATMRASSSIDYWTSQHGLAEQQAATAGGAAAGLLGGARRGAAGDAQQQQQPSGATGVVRTVACSPVRTLVAAGGDDMRLRLWAPLACAKRDH